VTSTGGARSSSGSGSLRVGTVSTTARLRSAGLSPAQIRRLVRNGTLLPVRRGVYGHANPVGSTAGDEAAGGEAEAQLLHVAAALAATGSLAAGSHRSAAAVHGLPLLGRRSPGIVTVTRSPGDRGSRSGRGILVHAAELPAEHVTICRGVRVTSAARTVIDIARTSPFTEGVVVADSALYAGQTSKGELEGVVARCRRWPGLARARRVVAFSDPRSESVLESIARVAFHEHGLPAPELQV